MNKKIYTIISYLIFLCLITTNVFATTLKKIIINGNDRISDETIKMFSTVKKGQNISDLNLNIILKDLYETNFFKNVSVEINENQLIINVVELPIIQNVSYEGIKSNKLKKKILSNLNLKSKSSYNELLLKNDKEKILSSLRNEGYYFSEIQVLVEELSENKVDIKYEIILGNKSKIKKIKFIGNKVFKDGKLKSLIVSEEYKFWKFISGKKFLNENIIDLDKRLLRNYYLNKGYYNVIINASYARFINEDEFELIFNIDAKNKVYFNKIDLNLPNDFETSNFENLFEFFSTLQGEPYSLNIIDDILDEVDAIVLNDEFRSVDIDVNENIDSDKINITFSINESPSYVVEKINIFGNNVTRENVIRNQLEIDEGDYFNKILHKKSINNIKSLNFFKSVNSDVVDGKDQNSKIINFSVEEKPTGEISAGAGAGTNGGTIMFGLKENNYLGKGLSLNTNIVVNSETVKGLFSVYNPNYRNSDKSVYTSLEATETDRLAAFGYKTNKTGIKLGTNFEYLRDFKIGLSTNTLYEKIETDSTASKLQKKQEGNYFDTFLGFDIDYDKRNQKYQTSDGFRSMYSVELPIVSKTNTLTNTYNYKYFTELYENNLTNFSLYLQSATSLSSDDIKLTERLFVPSRKLRGFERGKIGPKDGDDFVGGNYLSAINFSTTVPQLLENAQDMDLLLFFDAANIWGIDYDDSLDDGSKIRSSIGIGLDWNTAIGPMTFTLSEALTKSSTDVTESFRFNIGTTF